VPHLHGWTDSDFGSCLDSPKINIWLHILSWWGSGIVEFKENKTTVATSTCEAEYVAACHALKEAIWLQNLLELIGHPQTKPTELFSDNKKHHQCHKLPCIPCPIETYRHPASLSYENESNLKLSKSLGFPSTDMTADILTKALPCPAHEKLTQALGLHSTNPSWLPPIEGEC